MENLADKIEEIVLESAERARSEGNQAWELEALRLHVALRKLGYISATPETSDRFSIVNNQEGCVVNIEGKEVLLDGKRAKFMDILAHNPNRLVSQNMVNNVVFGGKVKYDAIQSVWEQLRSQVGENYFVRAHRRGFIFLHPDTLLPED